MRGAWLSREIFRGAGVLLLLIVLMMWLSGVFVGKVRPRPAAEKEKNGAHKTWTVEKQTYPLLVEQTGTVRGKVESLVASRIMAQVEDIWVQEGQDVLGNDGAGRPTLLAQLNDQDIRARLRQAESQVAAAARSIDAARAKLTASRANVLSARANAERSSRDFQRIEALTEQNAATKQQLDHIRAQRDSSSALLQAASNEARAAQSEIEREEAVRDAAGAVLSEARTNLSYTRVYAPVSGKLLRKMVDVGNMASPGQPLFLIETNQQPEFHAVLSESLLPVLKEGQEFEVVIDALQRPYAGVLRQIVPQSDPGTRTVLVKISLPADPELMNGLFGRLRVPRGEYGALAIPANSVREIGQLYMVDVIGKDGNPLRRFITLGRRHDAMVEVLSGLAEHEEVVMP